MAQDQLSKYDFLRDLYLFDKLSDSQIEALASKARVLSFNRGNIIYSQGDPATHFYILQAGKARLITGQRKDLPKTSMALLIYGDFFGEDCFSGNRRLDSAVALVMTQVFEFDRSDLMDLFTEAPEIGKLLQATVASRQLARRRHFAWLGDEEAIYLINRKHEFFLGINLIIPAILGLISLALLGISLASGNFLLLGSLSLVLGFLTVAWMVWDYLDWENDFYIITSRRVVWREKIIMLYESRHEVPLETILSTKRLSNPSLTKFIDYGTVIVSTYTGSIVMRNSQRPDLFIRYVDGLKVRSQAISRQIADRAMEASIRRRLGMEAIKGEEDLDEGEKPAPQKPPAQVRTLWKDFSKFFYMRFAEGNQITYRKHWIVLLRKTWVPAMVNFLIIGMAIFLAAKGILTGVLAIALWLVVLMGTGFWWFYNILDWHDDIYILTVDSIIDIDQKPFIRLERRVAKLENILSMEHARSGILGMLLNFGTVTINIGAEKFHFTTVRDPVQVQYEIFDRMNEVRAFKQEEQAIHEREQVANWLAIYTKQLVELENLEKNPKEDNLSG